MTATTSFDCEDARSSECQAVDKREVSSQKKYGIYCSCGILFGAAVMAGFFVLGPLCKDAMKNQEVVNHSRNHGLGKAFMMPAPWNAEKTRLPLAAHAAPLYAETSPFLVGLPARPGVAWRAHVSAMAVAKKTDVDGNEIKGPMSAYMYFCKERRPRITAELKASNGPAFKNADVLAACGVEWSQLGEADKGRFAALAVVDKARYYAAVVSNPANALIDKPPRDSNAKTDADGNEIKGAMSAYMYFCKERRPRITAELKASNGPAFKNSDVLVACGAEWRQLDEAEKARFAAMAAEDKARYDAAVASNPANALIKSESKKNSGPKGPKKLNAYMHFCAERRQSLTAELKVSMGADFKQPAVMTQLGVEWRQLDPASKARFEQKAAEPVE